MSKHRDEPHAPPPGAEPGDDDAGPSRATGGDETRDDADTPSGASALFVGELTQNAPFDRAAPSTYCVDGEHYRGATARLGRVNLFGDVPDAVGTSWAIVEGRLHDDRLFDQLEPDGECPDNPTPPIQWRSDWTADEGGYETTQAALEAASWLEVDTLTVLDEPVLSIERPAALNQPRKRTRKTPPPSLKGEEVTIEVRNPFDDRAWEDVELRARYESTSHGKPMPLYEIRTLTLEPGESVTVTLPASIEREEGGLEWLGVFADAHLRGGVPRALGSASHADP